MGALCGLTVAVNEDDDECLRLRLAGSLQAEQPCQLCRFPPDCTHSDLILLPLVKNAVMTIVSTPLPCTAVRDRDPDHVPLACHRGVGSGSFSIPASWRDRTRDLPPPCVACDVARGTIPLSIGLVSALCLSWLPASSHLLRLQLNLWIN